MRTADFDQGRGKLFVVRLRAHDWEIVLGNFAMESLWGHVVFLERGWGPKDECLELMSGAGVWI